MKKKALKSRKRNPPGKVRDRAEIARRTAAAPELGRAAGVSRMFHGRPVHWIKDVDEETIHRDKLAGLGKLLRLEVERDGRLVEVLFPEAPATMLAATADAKSLVLVGGDQRIPLAQFGIRAPEKDFVDLGIVRSITYLTSKVMDGSKPTDYTHHFGKPGGRGDLLTSWQKELKRSEEKFPRLVYDSLNRKLLLVGGAYTIRKEGLVY